MTLVKQLTSACDVTRVNECKLVVQGEIRSMPVAAAEAQLQRVTSTGGRSWCHIPPDCTAGSCEDRNPYRPALG